MMSTLLAILLLAQGGLPAAIERTGVSRDGLGILVSTEAGTVLVSIAPSQMRTPASNQKILTAALALDRLGRDFHFRTTFLRGTDGSLVVKGDGDPNMSGRFFDGDPNAVLRKLARDLKRKGVTRVAGDLVLDATKFDGQWRHPDWPRDQLDRWYCAPVAALVYNDSCWDITVGPGADVGDPARVSVEPSLLSPRIALACRTVAVRKQHVVHIGREEDGFSVKGGVLRGSTGVSSHMTVKEPVLFFGRALRAALAAEGVAVDGRIRLGVDPDAKPVLVYRSPIKRALKVMMTDSQNLYAECLLKRAGDGTFAGSAAMFRSYGPVKARDGSGMSKHNKVAPATLHRILMRFKDDPLFVDSFPAGGEGTLRRRYRELGERVRAKTGTISGVSSLSGYVTSRGGKRFVFVILCNGRSTSRSRSVQNAVVKHLAGLR